jgi:membrane-bound serine protease (ClpP class)
MNRLARLFLLLGLLIVNLAPATLPAAAQSTPQVVLLTADGALTPVMVNYVDRGLTAAETSGAEAVVIELNTPGGSINLMEDMTARIRSSTVPVIVFVSPAGSMAGSAGTLITLSGHVAAMAPDTTIGAASPVGSQGENIDTTEETKVKEMMKASVRNLTADRPLAAQKLAESMIEEAKAVTVDEALAIGLVDIKARSLDGLLEQLDGRVVKMADGDITLHTLDARVVDISPNLLEEALGFLTDPNIVFLLLSVGVQAVLIELSSPGGWVAGFIGVVCLLLAVFGLGILPVNWFGILFLVVAFVLFILDIKAPTHGALTTVGVITFIIGALVLFSAIRLPGSPETVGGPSISTPLVIGTGIVLGLSFFAIVSIALRAQRAPVKTGREALPGRIGMVRSELTPRGQVQVAGELWTARLADGEEPLLPGAEIVVVEVDGLEVVVKKFIRK